MGGWIIIFISIIVAVACFRGLLRPGKQRDEYWNGPAPAPEQQVVNRQWIAEFIERWPCSELATDYPELAEQARITGAYRHLEEMYAAGEIDEIDYQIELDKLASSINIEEFTEKPPTSPHQRFF